ncbi:MAG: YifB family Mg chelatase-like AAA ATPase [Muribaculaceae bacterium]|nr:YifB family Mg chelatase-like AAA ATPase [Muribaculaceae bacterium]
MLVKTYGAAVQGIDAILVTIEVVVENGIGFTVVGLPDAAVKESRERVESALKQSDQSAPRRKVVINMAPADVRKEGAAYDLPQAVGILAADEKLSPDRLADFLIMGELSLDGSVLPIRGVLPMAIKARELGFKGMIVPEANVREAAVVNNIDVYGVSSLRQVLQLLAHGTGITPTVINTREEFARAADVIDCDFSEVKGQESVKRAIEIACAGAHNILMIGPPGSGKSMMAKRIPSILPPLTLSEALETTKIHSVAGKLHRDSMLMTSRPFRSPHHTISPVALVGGGSNPMPGEISLAHNGVLFLDEFPEFSRSVLEVMRQPLEDRCISVSRARYSIDYPAGFMLVASMNPCPCGYYTHPTKPCTCLPGAVQKYLGRISGPLLDRIDMHIEIMPVPFDQISSSAPAESSEAIRERVIAARRIQSERFAEEKGIYSNSRMNTRLLRTHATLDPRSMSMLRDAMVRFDMSARAYDRILRVARTIADLDSASRLPHPSSPAYPEALRAAVTAPITPAHISEAINYRNLDRSSWSRGY